MNCAICLKEIKPGRKLKVVETATRTVQGFDRDDLGELAYLHVRCWNMALNRPDWAGMGVRLVIPDYDEEHPEPYPGDIKPEVYRRNEVVALLRQHAGDPKAVRFIADMLEE